MRRQEELAGREQIDVDRIGNVILLGWKGDAKPKTISDPSKTALAARCAVAAHSPRSAAGLYLRSRSDQQPLSRSDRACCRMQLCYDTEAAGMREASPCVHYFRKDAHVVSIQSLTRRPTLSIR